MGPLDRCRQQKVFLIQIGVRPDLLERPATHDRSSAHLWSREQTGGRQRADQMRVPVRVRDAGPLRAAIIRRLARAHRIVTGGLVNCPTKTLFGTVFCSNARSRLYSRSVMRGQFAAPVDPLDPVAVYSVWLAWPAFGLCERPPTSMAHVYYTNCFFYTFELFVIE